jgi:cellulose synthase/poly-beta-1,6-N-acetylglucosamine synthase-like glycosyltransferase
MPPQLTIIIPVFNEQESLGAFLDAVRMPLAQALDVIGPQASAELLFVDDGSSDRTPDMLAILAGLDARPLSPLVRNFGKEAAIAPPCTRARGGRGADGRRFAGSAGTAARLGTRVGRGRESRQCPAR